MNRLPPEKATALPPIPAFAWRGSLSPFLLVPASLPPLALAAAPANVLNHMFLLRAFTEWMKEHIPYMTVHADSTQIPQVALLVNCLVVAAVPVVACVALLQSAYNYPYLLLALLHLTTGPHPMRFYFLLLLGALLFSRCHCCHDHASGGSILGDGLHNKENLVLRGMVFFMPLVAGHVLGAQVLALRLFVNAYLFPASAQRRR